MKRIIIIGVTCSGKTTFGEKLSKRVNLPFIDLDDIYWLDNWVRPADDVFKNKVRKIVTDKEWVMVGNYKIVRDIVWEKADTVIFLKMPWWLCLWRVFKRSFSRVFTKNVMCNNNTDTVWRTFFSKDSIFVWFFKTYGWKTKQYTEFLNDKTYHPHLNRVTIRSRKECLSFLDSIKEV